MVAYGITEHHPYRRPPLGFRPPAPSRTALASEPPRATLRTTEDDIASWKAALAADTDLIRNLTRD